MKKGIFFVLLLATFVSYAQDQYALKCQQSLKNPTDDKMRTCEGITQEFSLKCVSVRVNPSHDMIRECQRINNDFKLSCVNSLKSVNSDKIRSCSQISNSYSAGCVAHWKNASSDMILACTSIKSEWAEACVKTLPTGTPDLVNACSGVKDEIGLVCVKDLEQLSYDKINFCALRSSLPNNHLDCYHCSQAEKETALRVYTENVQMLDSTIAATNTKVQEIVNDKNFMKDSKSYDLSLSCITESLNYNMIRFQYASNRMGVELKEKIPGAQCVKLFKRYEEFKDEGSKEKSLLDWFKKK